MHLVSPHWSLEYCKTHYTDPTNHQTQNVMGMVLDNRWREVSHAITNDKCGGTPIRTRWRHDLDATGWLEHHEAEALRWWFICASHASDEIGGGLCIETRLVAFKIRYSYSATPIALIDAMDGRGDMPDDMPKPEPEPTDS